jgi:NAD(P)H dehydrogenase (quinone)
MLLVTGSTGHFGQSAIGFLLEKGLPATNISALARNREKAAFFKASGVNVIFGNYDDYDSMKRAFTGIDVLLFISGSEVEKRDKQHDNIIMAAAETGIRHIIYTSFERKNDRLDTPVASITRTHIETEKKILETGIRYTFLRNALYAEGLPLFLGENVVEKGIYFPAGNGKVPFASITDMSESAANILLNPEDHANRSYRTVNLHNYSFYEIAAILGELTGRNVRYFCPSPEEFTESMLKAGLPEQTISGIVGWANGIKEGYFESDHSDMEMLLGRKPKDLKTILGKIYQKAMVH